MVYTAKELSPPVQTTSILDSALISDKDDDSRRCHPLTATFRVSWRELVKWCCERAPNVLICTITCVGMVTNLNFAYATVTSQT